MHSGPVAILETDSEALVTSEMSHEVRIDKQPEHVRISFAKLITIWAKTVLPVVLVSSRCKLMTIERIQKAKVTKRKLSTRGPHELRAYL